MSDNPASWQPDPTGRHDHRYWDGAQWTDDVADAGVADTDPYETASSHAVSPDGPTAVTPLSADDTTPYPIPVPPPYVPPSPVGGPHPSAGASSSKRALVIGGAILAAVALLVIAVLALGDDDEPTEPLAGESPGTTGGDDPADTDADTDGFEGDADADTDAGDGFSDEGVDDFDDLEDFEDLDDLLGLSEEQAECLEDRFSELAEDELADEQSVIDLFEVFADCDISIADLGMGYRPVQRGGRFSLNAAMPSAASSVDAVIVSRGWSSRRLASTS